MKEVDGRGVKETSTQPLVKCVVGAVDDSLGWKSLV
jgi:hypothetical protein